MPARSPLAPDTEPALPPLAGVRLAAAQAGVRYRNRTDACLFEFAAGTRIAGVLTRSLTAAAPAGLCRALLAGGRARAILVTSGNANAFTGREGRAAANRCAAALAERLGCGR